MNPSWRISRRTMLRGVGAAVALPLLDVMRPLARAAAPASATAPPVNRICYLFFPNGVADGAWAPAQVDVAGRLVRLNRWMTPLEPFASDVIIPQRMWTPQGNGHGAGDATWLTGGSYDSRRIDAGGTSVDQLAARRLASHTLLPCVDHDNIRWTDDVPGQDQAGLLAPRIFGSAHPAAFHMVMCDGSVQAIAYGVDEKVHRVLGNRQDEDTFLGVYISTDQVFNR